MWKLSPKIGIQTWTPGRAEELAEKQTGNEMFRKYFAAYFYQLAQTHNMAAFARLISQSKPESAKWIQENPARMSELDNWVKTTERS